MTSAAAAPSLTRPGPVGNCTRRPELAFLSPSVACGEAAAAIYTARTCERAFQSKLAACNGEYRGDSYVTTYERHTSLLPSLRVGWPAPWRPRLRDA